MDTEDEVENQNLIDNGRVSYSSWFIYHKYKFAAAFALLFLVICAIVLGLIPLYISSSDDSDDAATASNNFDEGWSNFDNSVDSKESKKRLISLAKRGKDHLGNENTTILDMECGGRKFKLGNFVNKGFKNMKKQNKIGKTVKSPKINFVCNNNKLEETLEFGLLSGNQTFDLPSIDGYYFNSTHIINMYKKFSEMEAETTVEARALKKDISQTQTKITGTAFNAKTGILATYNGCIYDANGVASNLATCYSEKCVKAELCDVIPDADSTAKEDNTDKTDGDKGTSKFDGDKGTSKSDEDKGKSKSDEDETTNKTDQVDETTTKKRDESKTRKPEESEKSEESEESEKSEKSEESEESEESYERGTLEPRVYDIVSELVEYTYVMEIGYKDTIIEINTKIDENADTEMSLDRDKVESVEDMVV